MLALPDIEAALLAQGLAPRGAFHAAPDDGVPPLGDGRPARTLVLAGQVGASQWERFVAERRDEPDPLDRWAARALDAVAARFGARRILPGDGPPHPPFLRWAARAESVHPSPLGLLIHPEYGLWHAYRGALAFAEEIAVPARRDAPSPCASCVARPCLRACPVGAFGPEGFAADACAAHLARDGEPCFAAGCLARAACPVGRAHRYPPAAARFHLAAFVAGVGRTGAPE